MLVFPESLSKKEIERLEERMKSIEEFSKQNKGVIDMETMAKLKELGLLSLQSGDRKWSSTETLRLFEGLPTLLCHFILNHNFIGVKGIEAYGSDELKAVCLPRLISGLSTVAFCYNELHNGDDLSQITTTAEASRDGHSYILNGTKTWVSMIPELTDLFVVFAKVKNNTRSSAINETQVNAVTAFLLDKTTMSTITTHPALPTIGKPATMNAYHVELTNVTVPLSHVLGHEGNGFKVAVELIYSSIFLETAHNASMLRSALGHVSKHCIEHKQFNRPVIELPLIQEKLGRMCVYTYVMESMAYMCASMVDDGCYGDVYVESACTQVFSSEHLRRGLEDGVGVMGRGGCYGENPVAKLLSSLSYDSIVGTDMLRRYIALNCLQHGGQVMQQSIMKLRNPLNHLSHLFREGWRAVVVDSKYPPLTHHLHHAVHPDLSICAESLETRVLLLKELVAKYWTTFYNKLEEEELALKRFSDIAIHTFAITSCLARATRAKSIGLMNADFEIMTCQAVVARLVKMIDSDLENLDLGDHSNGDIYLKKLAGASFKKQAYPLEHPLNRNW